MPASPSTAVLAALGYALFVPDKSGALRPDGEPPAWLLALWPGIATTPLAELSPFLENFLIDAADAWRTAAARLPSGAFVERDSQGADVQLEATALTASGQPVLLIERLGEAFEAKKSVLQKARETVIAYQRLSAEMQKRDILLHCFAEDFSASLANIITALRLVEIEQDPVRTRHLMHLAMLSTREQQDLIGRVLNVFADEIAGLYGRDGTGADLLDVAQRAATAIAPHFVEKGVRLDAPPAGPAVRIAASAAHLDRVITNLLENALRHTPAGFAVAMGIESGADGVLLRIDDEGPTLHSDISEQLFARLAPSAARSPEAVLRLHFCRIAVENCHGEIGYSPGPTGGNRFWIRLPGSTPTP